MAPNVKSLVLDSGPLLSQTPLRGLADRYLTVPQVLDELKDKRAREHFERLELTAGVHIEIRQPDAIALAKVVDFAKKTGDYAVLSHADLCVLALTCTVAEEAIFRLEMESMAQTLGTSKSPQLQKGNVSGPLFRHEARQKPVENLIDGLGSTHLDGAVEQSSQTAHSPTPMADSSPHIDTDDSAATSEGSCSGSDNEPTPLFDDPPSEEDDGEGEWITASNVALHKSRALDLLPAEEAPSKTRGGKGCSRGNSKGQDTLAAGCMTADFAMQNVLLQMGLNLVGVEGKRIDRVKTWVLRCHACFKICKDSTKKFCPSCGNPTLLRTSITSSSPRSPGAEPKLQVHLKKNFQWRNRGTIYSIPSPKPGTSKTGAGEGLILREDQTAWVRAEKRAEGRRVREEKKMMNALGESSGLRGPKLAWMDPDWLPEMLSVGSGGKGRSSGKGDMPVVGHGRKNPNEKKRRKK